MNTEKRKTVLAPLKFKVFRALDDNPNLTLDDLRRMFQEEIEQLKPSRRTLAKWRDEYRHKKDTLHPPEPPKEKPKVTWEDIIREIPDTRTLGILLVDGITAELFRLQLEAQKVKVLQEEVQSLKNELAKVHGHYTIDKVRERLIPKS